MAISLKNYLDNLEKAFDVALCLRNFPSQMVEKHNKPEIELAAFELALATREEEKPVKGQVVEIPQDKLSKRNYKVLNPVTVARSNHEYCLIEQSINSVRISFVFKKMAPLDKLVVKKISSFFQKRAETLFILRKVPIDGYDISFLVTNFHMEKFNKSLVIDWLLDFVETIAQEINTIKLNLNTQARIAATYFVNMMASVDQQ